MTKSVVNITPRNNVIDSSNIQLDMSLYSLPTSPYGMKVSSYLAYLGVNYQFVGVNPINFKEIAFANLRQVPVLQIGDEWKQGSSEIGMWLHDRFPSKHLLGENESERKNILALDQWINEALIPLLFRMLIDWPSLLIGFKNGWKLSRAIHRATPIPKWVQILWPIFLTRADFIIRIVNQLDRSESLQTAQHNLVEEFVGKLAGGPFLGGNSKPTLADLSAYPNIAFPRLLGLEGNAEWHKNLQVVEWMEAVKDQLNITPFMIDESLLSFG